ncbi:MAG: sorbosone dehydrogenase, partial [Alphaproteobacteria bacterium]|nr:sorbosone dehydrogenase [Alphaproteobacteria bacterium]
GRPAGGYETFLTGFTEGAGDASGSGRARLWGRPAGLLVLSDGSLLVADDTARVIWRVSYSGTE